MATKHFFKVLFVFTLMIAFGLVSMVIISNWDGEPVEAEVPAPLADSETVTPDSCDSEVC